MNLPLFHSDPSCVACPRHVEASHVCIPTIWLPGSLEPGPDVPVAIFIGQNPGFHEDEDGVPFIGKSGELLRDVYIDGISLCSKASIYLTNTARCGPSPDLKNAEYRTCFPLYTVPDLQSILQCHLASSSSSASTSVPAPPAPLPSSASAPTAVGSSKASTLATQGAFQQGLAEHGKKPSSRTTSSKAAVILLGAPATFHFWKHYTGHGKSLREGSAVNGTSLTIDGFPVNVFSTDHPTHVLRDNNYIHNVYGHMGLVLSFFEGTMASPSSPTIVPTRSPRTK